MRDIHRLPGARTPLARIRVRGGAPVRAAGDRVVYWMIAARRTRWNFGLQRAIEWSRHLGKPLVVLEALRLAYPRASDRLHRFVIEGMADNARRFARAPVLYHPYVEPDFDAGKGLVDALAARACVIVTDDYPCFFLPHMVASFVARAGVLVEEVDSNGLSPIRTADRVFKMAAHFRRWQRSVLPDHLADPPQRDPLARLDIPRLATLETAIASRWPRVSDQMLAGGALSQIPIDHAVVPSPLRGGAEAGRRRLRLFVAQRLGRYETDRDHPDADATSHLSPYLHFGHLSSHEILAEVARREEWSPADIDPQASGRAGFWGMSRGAEAFLDQLVTWRELGFNFCAYRDDYARWESLPEWSRTTLERHTSDDRPRLYTPHQLEAGRTADPIWNAAQRQLVDQGRIHSYMRMLWGKKILEWSRTPRKALSLMIHLNDKYALDGRDPNSYSGIGWVFGRYDRPWGPQRPVFGVVRYMSTRNAARKLRLRDYVERWSG